MIDPQLQGIKWIKNRFEKKLTVIRIGQRGYLDTIERKDPLAERKIISISCDDKILIF